MNEIRIPKPNCIDCYDWGIRGLFNVLSVNIAVIIVFGICIELIIHWFKERNTKIRLLNTVYWMLVIGVLEVGYFIILSQFSGR